MQSYTAAVRPRQHPPTRLVRLLLCLAVALFALGGMLAPPGAGTLPQARATVPGTDAVALSWDTNDRAYYGQYNTPIFTNVGTDGRVSFAYCVDPTTTVPAAGSYQTIPVEQFNPYWATAIRAAMWFSYGGPGFDPAMWPTTWNDGSSMDAAKYYAASHLILTYATTQEMGRTYYNSGSNFINYAAGSFLGINLAGETVNANSTMFQMFNRAGEVPADYVCYYLNCGRWDYTQFIIGQDYYAPSKPTEPVEPDQPAPPDTPTGSLLITKQSSNAAVSDGNACYSLAGAEFAVFADQACSQRVATVRVGDNGIGRADGLAAQTYWVAETAAPAGFLLDPTVRQVEVPASDTVALTAGDAPRMVPFALVANKADAVTGVAQGSATLAGAQFTVQFFAGSYDAASLPATPARTWVFATDDQGRAVYAPEYLVSGDALYYDADGQPALPLGTLSVRETQAPDGYLLSDDQPRVIAVVPSDGAACGATFETPGFSDIVKTGGLSVQKVDAETGAAYPQGAGSLAGAQFSIISLNANPVSVGGWTYSWGETVATLQTDGSGYAATRADALPCGHYRVEETGAPAGYLPAGTAWEVDVAAGAITPVGDAPAAATGSRVEVASTPKNTVGTNPVTAVLELFLPASANAATPDGPVVGEQVIRGGIRAYKVDADTGTGQAQGDATLAGTEFSIVSLNNGPVLVDGTLYGYGEVVKKIYTDATGMAQTGNRDLPYGTYTVEETNPPNGYQRSVEFVRIEHDGVIVEVNKPYENDVIRGGIRVQKTDSATADGQAQGDATLAGTVFAIANASDQAVIVNGTGYAPGETIMTIETDESGVAQTGSYDLPYGTYRVTEIAAPQGYQLGAFPEQTVSVYAHGVLHDATASFANDVVRGGVSLYKFDADIGQNEAQGQATLAGAQFGIVNASAHPVVVGGVAYQPGETVDILVTDESGFATTGERDLPYGTYTVLEIAAPDGYLLNAAPQTVQVREEAVIVPVANPFTDQVQRGGFGIRKFDAETGLSSPQGNGALAGARYAVINANGQAVIVNGVRYEPGETVAIIETNADGWAQTGNHDLPYGTYTVLEIAAPTGYHLGLTDENGIETDERRSLTATVDGEWSWHSYESELYDQIVRGGLSIAKTDADTGEQAQGDATLEGALFAVVNASSHAVVVQGRIYDPGATVMTLTTDADGQASTGERDLPYGAYTVREVGAPSGYLLGDGSQTVTVAAEGVVVAATRPFADQVIRGGASVQKIDVEVGATGPQGAATYQGAVFEIVNASALPVFVNGSLYQIGEVVTTMTTDADGHAATPQRTLPFGTYLVREAKAPAGYLVNTSTWTITVTADGEVLEVGDGPVSRQSEAQPATAAGEAIAATPRAATDTPTILDTLVAAFSPASAQASEAVPLVPEQVIKGGVRMYKIDAETGLAQPQGGATLQGTQIAIVSLNDNPVVVDGTMYANGEVVAVVETDVDGVAATGELSLPYGVYGAYEAAAPVGYLPSGPADPAQMQTFAIDQNGAIVDLETPFEDSPVRGGIDLQKVDAQTGADLPLADAELTGAQFAIVNANEHAVTVGGVAYEPGETVATLVTDVTGHASTGPNDLPYGTYTVQEVRPPEGYLADSVAQTATVDQNGVVASCPAPFSETLIRGDVAGVKVEDETGLPMANVAFLVTSLTTGERHVLLTGPDGAFSTASARVPHTQQTNANDDALGADGTVANEAALSLSNGIWFSGSTDAAVEPDDARGALPYDRYRFDELLTSANYGHSPVSFEIAVREDGVTVDAGTIDNHMIALATTARLASTGTNEGPAEQNALVVDRVSYTGLVPGCAYELRCTVFDRDSGLPLEGIDQPAAVMPFVPSAPQGTVELSFALDASSLAGTRAVVFETLYLDDQELASHRDLADDAQTVTFVSISTTATGQLSGTHEEEASSAATIVDAVAYHGLTPGTVYTLEGTLMDKATAQPLLNSNGERVASSIAFVAASASGTIDLMFEFDAAELAGTDVVAFETLANDGVEIARHADIDDLNQTVRLISIETVALDRATGSHTGTADAGAAVIDTVAYAGLTPGERYALEGALVDPRSGAVIVDARGEACTAAVEFVPSSEWGAVTVTFELDASNMGGRSAVAVETLLHGDAVVASHADLNDRNQTVDWPIVFIPQTGQAGNPLVSGALLLGGAAASLTAAAVLLRKRRRRVRA